MQHEDLRKHLAPNTKQLIRFANIKQAVADIQGDQYVQQLIENFDGKLDLKSIEPQGN